MIKDGVATFVNIGVSQSTPVTLVLPLPASAEFARIFRELLLKQSSICRAWLGTAGISLFRAAIAFAQETAPEPAPMAEAERVIVTGSHIPSAEESGPNPCPDDSVAAVTELHRVASATGRFAGAIGDFTLERMVDTATGNTFGSFRGEFLRSSE